jgi:flagellar basal-body rod modification protein FlgD
MMTTISATDYTTSTTSTTTSGTSDEMQVFLELLLTQLENQNPLDTVDSTEFTNQLVQYSSLEQEMETNDQLESLLASMSSLSTLSYIGKTVAINSNAAPLQNGEASWDYYLEEDAAEVTITVKDADGNVVYEGAGNTEGGADHAFTLTTEMLGDAEVAEGEALLITVTAKNADGDTIETATSGKAVIDAVDNTTGETMISAGTLIIDPSLILRITA